MARQKEILDIIKQETQQFLNDKKLSGKSLDALSLSIDLKSDRANISRELNRLWKNGILIKIQGKPTSFLDHQTLENFFPQKFIPSVIGKNELISKHFGTQPVEYNNKEASASSSGLNDLDFLIGSRGSLAEAVLLAKSAVSYPEHGLHILLTGDTGAGKRRFAECIYNYALKSGVMDTSAPFVTVPCHTFSQDIKLFSLQLLGSAKSSDTDRSKRGFLDRAKGGILFFDGAEHLAQAELELLNSVLKREAYSRHGETIQRSLCCMIIISCNSAYENKIKAIFDETLPIKIHIPSFEKREPLERIGLTLQLFFEEAASIHRPIKLPKDILLCFAGTNFKENIIGLRNEIKTICSKAFLDSYQNSYRTLYINYNHMSSDMLSQSDASKRSAEFTSILEEFPYDYVLIDENGYPGTEALLKTMPAYFSEPVYGAASKNISRIISRDAADPYDSALNNIKSFNQIGTAELLNIKQSIYPIVYRLTVAELKKEGRFETYNKHIQLLYGMLLTITEFIKREEESSSDASSIGRSSECQEKEESWIPGNDNDSVSAKLFPEEYKIASNILSELSNIYHCRFTIKDIDYLSSYLSILGNWSKKSKVGLLIICHGNSTASDMTEHIKELLGDNLPKIDSIDFRKEESLAELMEEVLTKAEQVNTGAGVLILTDMEPLTSLNDFILKELSIPVRLVHPVNLPLAIKAARKAFDGCSLDDFNSLYNQEPELLHSSSDITNNFIHELSEKVISQSTVFIDVKKALSILDHCLKGTLTDLKMPYTDTIAAKYLCHCCNMLERVIKGEPWEYTNLKGFTNKNYRLMHIVEQNLEYAENSYGINIASSEVAYICEIFLE